MSENELNYQWYAIQTYAGSEQSVKKAIENIFNQLKAEEKLKEILVPTEDVIEIKDGEKKITERSLYPGYVFAHLVLDMDVWHKIQSLPKVSRFIGESKKPTPLRKKDVELILEKAHSKAAPKPKISFTIGESVRINEGPFANFTGQVEEYDMVQGKLKLNVSIFGRSTPVEILYSQVERII
jgi:transcriptional antiterminator NusG